MTDQMLLDSTPLMILQNYEMQQTGTKERGEEKDCEFCPQKAQISGPLHLKQ